MIKKELVNADVREAIKQAGLRHFEIFDELKICQASWTRLLCRPLSIEDKQKIMDVVKKLSTGR